MDLAGIHFDEYEEADVDPSHPLSQNGSPVCMNPQQPLSSSHITSIITTTIIPKPTRKRKAGIGIPTDNYFTHTFEVLSSFKQEQLERCYAENEGRLPSRIGLRAMSQEMGLSQNRIRKWFYDRSRRKLEEARNSFGRTNCEVELEALLLAIRDNWQDINELDL